MVDAYDAILEGSKQSQEALAAPAPERMERGLATASRALSDGLGSLDRMMALAEDVKKPYLQPQLLRDLSTLRAYVADLAAAVEGAAKSPGAVQRLRQMLAEVAR